MAAAAAGKGVLKFSPNKPKSRAPTSVTAQPFGVSSDRRQSSGRVVAAAHNAAEQLGEAAATAAAAATAVRRGTGTSPETDRATQELESSIRDLQGIVATLAKDGDSTSAASPAPTRDDPTRREVGGGPALAGTRTVQSERYTNERQERQARLQKLYAELNKT